MGILGLVTKRDYQKLYDELEALKAATTKYAPWMLATAEGSRWSLPDPSVYENQADLYRKLSWVLAAVDITAQAAALAEFQVKRVISGKEPKDIPNHDFEVLLRHPNPLDSRFEFLYATIAFWKLTGNAYWWLNRNSENDAPEEMWFIPSHMIRPLPDERMFLRGYMYDPGTGQEIFLEPYEIVHFRRFNPFNRFVGLSAVESIALTARGDLGMQDWQAKYFVENNARLPGILTFEQMIGDDQWGKIKEDTREASRKRELMLLRGVGQGGVQWLQNAVSQKDMEFLAARKFNKEEIWAALAPGLMTMMSENSTEANSRTGRAIFNELTVYPMHVMMAEKITNEILSVYSGRPLVGQFEDIRITDRALELEEQKLFSETHTVAEIREEFYGDDPLGDERDKLFPSQIKSQIQQIQPKPDTPNVIDNAAQNKQDNPQPPQPAQKALLDELSRWQRKALKRVGKAVRFESDIIPENIANRIMAGLPGCKTEDDIKSLFAIATPKQDVNTQLVNMLELAIKSLKTE